MFAISFVERRIETDCAKHFSKVQLHRSLRLRRSTSTACGSAFSQAEVSARVTLRQLATDDAGAAFDYLLTEASVSTATDFIESLEQAFRHLSRHPLTGSLRFAFELDIPELRCWRLNGFPYLVFYRCDENHVDVWRILHARRDIPSFLQEP